MRKIIHVDMDAFYAAVEQRDNPAYRGKPLVVGGSPHSRGVVFTCSYEARPYGIHSGMSSSQAYRLCPHAIFITNCDFSRYKEASSIIRQIFQSYTELVEPLSLDEAYLDVTQGSSPSATRIAEEIKGRIQAETGLTASAGVSYNKFIAKLASDYQKPDGLTVIPPDQGEAFVATLPIRKFWGVGAKRAEQMRKLGIYNGADLKTWELPTLIKHFGKAGPYYYYAARGVDERPVIAHRQRKSLGRERTFQRDLQPKGELIKEAQTIIGNLEMDMKRLQLGGRQLTLKVKYHNFEQITRTAQSSCLIRSRKEMTSLLPGLLERTAVGKIPVRLIGLTLGRLEPRETLQRGPTQLELFEHEGETN